MQYLKLDPDQRARLLCDLASMADYLESSFAGLSADDARRPTTNGLFSPVEQVWHLADLEQEGFAARLRRLATEDDPDLPDFDGAAIAAARDYRSLSLDEGLACFREARMRNLDTLRATTADAWERGGMQAGVGRVTLCDMPGFMAQHDAAHRAEIETWKQS